MPGFLDFLGGLFGGGGGGGASSGPFDFGGVDTSFLDVPSDFGSSFGDFGGGSVGGFDLGGLFGGGGGGGSGGVDLSNLFGGGTPSVSVPNLFGGGPPIDSISGGIAGNLSGIDLSTLDRITSPGGLSPIDSVSSGIAGNLAGISAGGVSGLNNLINSATPNGNLDSITAGLQGPLANLLKGFTAGGGGTPAGGNNGVITPGNPNASGSNPTAGTGQTGNGGGTPGSGTPGSGILGTGLTLPQLLAGLGLGGSLLQGNKLPPGADALQALADKNQQLVDNQLMPTALANQQGNINGQALSAIDRRLQESEAGMRSKYAAMGMSGSTMEQEDLAGLRANAQDQVFAEGQQMATSGLQTAAALTGQDTSIYEALMQAQVQQDEELSKAIAAFAGAVSK